MLEAVLTAAESIVTFRRRYRTRSSVDAVIELLVIDPFNPRSVAYQLQRIRTDLRALPNSSPTTRPLRLLDAGGTRTHRRSGSARGVGQWPSAPLEEFLAGLQNQPARSEAIRDQYQQPPPTQRPLFRTDALGGTA